MSDTVFVRAEFWTLVLLSLALPFGVVVMLLKKTVISRAALIASAALFIALAGVDVGLLQHVKAMARDTPGLGDNAFFLSEYSIALYLLPYIGAGIGINLLTYAITQHLRITGGGNSA